MDDVYYEGDDLNAKALFNGKLPPTHEAEYSSQLANDTNPTYEFAQELTGYFEIRMSQKDPGDAEFTTVGSLLHC